MQYISGCIQYKNNAVQHIRHVTVNYKFVLKVMKCHCCFVR